jgi:hypothetical protein
MGMPILKGPKTETGQFGGLKSHIGFDLHRWAAKTDCFQTETCYHLVVNGYMMFHMLA